MNDNKFTFIESNNRQDKEQIRPSLTYWQDAWRRLKKNKLAIGGLIGVIIFVLLAIFSNNISAHSSRTMYSKLPEDYRNIPPIMKTYKLALEND